MKQPIVILLLLLAAVALGVVLGMEFQSYRIGEPETIVIEHVDTLIRVYTVHKYHPIPKYVHVVDSFFVYVPIPGQSDSVKVALEREEKVYEDSTYRAVVSGYMPSLDSIDVFNREVIINKETTIREPYRKHWTVTVGAQAGYGITPAGMQPYLGGGVTLGYSF